VSPSRAGASTCLRSSSSFPPLGIARGHSGSLCGA